MIEKILKFLDNDDLDEICVARKDTFIVVTISKNNFHARTKIRESSLKELSPFMRKVELGHMLNKLISDVKGKNNRQTDLFG